MSEHRAPLYCAPLARQPGPIAPLNHVNSIAQHKQRTQCSWRKHFEVDLVVDFFFLWFDSGILTSTTELVLSSKNDRQDTIGPAYLSACTQQCSVTSWCPMVAGMPLNIIRKPQYTNFQPRTSESSPNIGKVRRSFSGSIILIKTHVWHRHHRIFNSTDVTRLPQMIMGAEQRGCCEGPSPLFALIVAKNNTDTK